MMRIAIYARVSTSDKDQNPETQLMPLRDYCQRMRWDVATEYVDQAPAGDLNQRSDWRALLDKTTSKAPGIDTVLVFKLDRAFRSVKHMHDTLSAWSICGVDFASVQEQFDTSSSIGRLTMNLLASFAEFELEIIRERVIAGMERARQQGKQIGRSKLEINGLDMALEKIAAGEISIREAAELLNTSPRTLRRRISDGGAKGEV